MADSQTQNFVETTGETEQTMPPNPLLEKVEILDENSNFDPIAEAENALEQASDEFEDWFREDLEKLFAFWQETADKASPSPEVLEDFYRLSNDIKGNASTFGYPYLGEVAASLCYLLDNRPAGESHPLLAVDFHIQAMRAMQRDNVGAAENNTARELCDNLWKFSRIIAPVEEAI